MMTFAMKSSPETGSIGYGGVPLLSQPKKPASCDLSRKHCLLRIFPPKAPGNRIKCSLMMQEDKY